MRGGALVAAAALTMLAWPAAARPAATVLTVALCNGGTAEIPIEHERERHDPGCATACHAALCGRKRSG